MKSSQSLAAVLVLFCCGSSLATTAFAADGVVSPNALSELDGNGNNAFPFNLDDFGIESMRFQQVYDGGDFAGAGGPVLITELRFRSDAEEGVPFETILPDIQINLSTTPFAVDQLSLFFDENLGADDTVVHSGPLLLSGLGAGADPLEFDIVIPLSTPFLYDPAQGSLLLDIRNYGGGLTTQFDSHEADGDEFSRAFTLFGGNADSLLAEEIDTGGLVTMFMFASDEEEPAIVSVVMDVIPGSQTNRVCLQTNDSSRRDCKSQSRCGRSTLPVAILTTEDFDATRINIAMLWLGDPGLAGKVSPWDFTLKDVDRDGDLDLLLEFSLQELVDHSAIDGESALLELTGLTLDGLEIYGVDAVTVDEPNPRCAPRGRRNSRGRPEPTRHSPPKQSSRGRSCRR